MTALNDWWSQVLELESTDNHNYISFYLDTSKDRILYQKFQFPRSFTKTWSIASLKFYAKQMVNGVSLPRFVEDDDIYQIGGNVVTKNNKILKIFVPENPTVRPSFKTMVEKLV